MNKKIICIAIISMFLLTTGLSTADSSITIKKISMNIKDQDITSTEDDDFNCGKMTIFAGDFPLYENWEIIVAPNPNFGGSDKKFIMEHGVCSITITADYEIKGDCPFDPFEQWDFFMWYKDMHYLASFRKDDTPIIDDSCNGTITATLNWCPISNYPDFSDGVLPLYIGLYVDYKRDGQWHTVEKYTRTVDVVAENEPPTPPIIEGPNIITWKPWHEDYPTRTFSLTSIDPDGDTIEYGWECTYHPFNWIEKEYQSGDPHNFSRTFHDFGKYTFRARARDTYYCNSFEWMGTAGWSEWSEPFTVKVTRFRGKSVDGCFERLLDRFPLLERLLNL